MESGGPESGFTLLEVLVALAILALALPALLGLWRQGSEGLFRQRRRAELAALAQRKLAEVRAGLEEGRFGQWEEGGVSYRWDLEEREETLAGLINQGGLAEPGLPAQREPGEAPEGGAVPGEAVPVPPGARLKRLRLVVWRTSTYPSGRAGEESYSLETVLFLPTR
ncbi:MAG: prepilin-type N-terminal cleavage/methylation domain-containing protein [Bacillota bacterium]|nr:prepilin-type N-terminal cleavage/methylation domain-containing protein [Bacillota bacterium]